jgi:excisionase family DNA binding protein
MPDFPTYPQFEKLLKADEVARVLRISRGSAYRLISAGKLPALRFGGKTVRVRTSDLERFIAGRPSNPGGKQA